MKLLSRVNQWIENWPWWWVLIPLAPFLIFIFVTARESYQQLGIQATQTVHLTDGVTVVFEVSGVEYKITDQTVSPNTVPDRCTLIPHTNYKSQGTFNYLSCEGKQLGTIACVLDCTLTSNNIVRIER